MLRLVSKAEPKPPVQTCVRYVLCELSGAEDEADTNIPK